MKVTVVQTDIAWEDKSANLMKLEKMLDFSPGFTDLIVLPEMFTTGFTMNPKEFAERDDSETFRWMQKIAGVKEAGICGSFITESDGAFYNRFIFVSPAGDIFKYDKRHLFSIYGEDQKYTRGKERLVFTYGGFRILPIICYDLRFPVWIRNRNDYDLIICVANWPESRRGVWNTLLRARAIENQCYVAGVNRIGKEGSGTDTAGESALIDAKGRNILCMKENLEGHATADLSLPDLLKFRKEFPVWQDADDFTLKL